MIGKILSLIISIIYLIAGYNIGGGKLFLIILVCLILPLACIWFSEYLGDYTGPSLMNYDGDSFPDIDKKTPGCLIALFGWMILLLLPVIWSLIN